MKTTFKDITALLLNFYNQCTDKVEMSHYFAIIYNIGDLAFIIYFILHGLYFVVLNIWKYIQMKYIWPT